MRSIALAAIVTGCSFTGPGTGATVDGVPGAPDAAATTADAAPGAPDAPAPPTADAAPCPAGYTLRVAGSCHRHVATPLNWQSAEADCETAGAHLVVVDDGPENAALPNNVWIGYTERVTAGAFRWVTGATPGFTGWAGGEPVAGGGLCTEARPDGWHDDGCAEGKQYVCEYDGLAADPAQF